MVCSIGWESCKGEWRSAGEERAAIQSGNPAATLYIRWCCPVAGERYGQSGAVWERRAEISQRRAAGFPERESGRCLIYKAVYPPVQADCPAYSGGYRAGDRSFFFMGGSVENSAAPDVRQESLPKLCADAAKLRIHCQTGTNSVRASRNFYESPWVLVFPLRNPDFCCIWPEDRRGLCPFQLSIQSAPAFPATVWLKRWIKRAWLKTRSFTRCLLIPMMPRLKQVQESVLSGGSRT